MLAWHWTVLTAEVLLMLVLPKSLGDVQVSGRLTGEPKAYKSPCTVPTYARPSPKTGLENLVTPGMFAVLIS